MEVGITDGQKSKVTVENVNFLAQHTIHADQANDGFTQSHVVEILQQQMQPDMSQTDVKHYVHRTFKTVAAGRIKSC